MRRLQALTLVAAATVLLTFAAPAGAKPESDASWTSFGHDQQLTAFTDAPAFTAQVKGFTLAWSAALSGAIVASPLAARTMAQGLVVFAATEGGNVYAIGDQGTVLWQKSIGTVSSNGNCGTYGVSSTGVIDTARGVLYVVGASGRLHALRLTDGSEAAGYPVQVVSRRRTEYVWGGLRLVGSTLYVPVALVLRRTRSAGRPGGRSPGCLRRRAAVGPDRDLRPSSRGRQPRGHLGLGRGFRIA